ncbi:MAG TPA: hypothetical protein PKD10_17110 [Paracoccaceae bacterium]|nr:hypothetical protein [Paracoccaceae bacterium]HMO70707.1 hypothetical protein [Paracoccaceae bacterium]
MTADVQNSAVPSWTFPGLFRRLRARIGGVNAAHAALRQHLAVTDRDIRDVGLLRDEVVGLPSHQPDLPFFMQRHFQADRL